MLRVEELFVFGRALQRRGRRQRLDRRRDRIEVPGAHFALVLDRGETALGGGELGAMGYKFQFITLAGFHSLNYSMFNLAHGYARHQMSAFVELQEAEFAAADKGFTAVKHQREVGTGYFDAVTTTIEKDASTAALHGSTEDEQFFDKKHA